ncbi:metal-dependent hydrolase [Aquabacterium sp. OR-4]|uniref:metal-dependent hydrolase n=1 Tax=Aquabacterium sp. OR-4 TaxID=2978127 RepID=UPI0021B30102|nr:metal-dependent hydrolase [Aquabacterium sp. OR-4]MDT7834932.1 metal-dependent hydrolase [Aquabacterium sp. OR-4]
MTDLPVRRLLVDLQSPFDRHWNGGDAFRSAFFNALSMSFPFGEQFFIDSVRAGLAALPAEQRHGFEAEVRGFIGQEATHRRLHGLYNDQLERQGLKNHWEPRSRRRMRALDGKDLRLHLAVTAAAEHFTAILAEYLLANDAALAGADERLALLWRWHSSEESEHRSTAFDLYRALGGNEKWRLRIFRVVSFNFVCDALRQTLNNLWHDGSWKRPATWVSGWRLLFGRAGLVREMAGPWRQYLRADFHPLAHGGQAGSAWLRDNAGRFSVVGSAR